MSPIVLLVDHAVRFGAQGRLWFLLLLPLAALLLGFGWRARKRARGAWAGELFERLAPGYDARREWMKTALFLLACGFVVVALARPQWGGEVVMMKRRGIDLVIAIDTSVSMLAEDMRPNRLEQAKREVADLLGQMGGDRVGLIAFAGEAFTVCPLTLDHGTVLLLLESLNVHSVSTPGTNLGDALRKARAAFVAGEQKHKALILVTDGESHEGDPIAEAKKAAEEGLVVYTIGIGSPDGEPIPERDDAGRVAGYKKDRRGKVVTSRLDEATLRAIAEESHGRYFRASPRGIELAAVLEDLQAIEKKELEGNLATSYEERFQWPLGVAALLLGIELLIPNRRRTREMHHA
ncbi:MAG: VWA domain-containing protein [Candidatus Krumholzibacteriia bacterium]